jgi:hypothetical protein
VALALKYDKPFAEAVMEFLAEEFDLAEKHRDR